MSEAKKMAPLPPQQREQVMVKVAAGESVKKAKASVLRVEAAVHMLRMVCAWGTKRAWLAKHDVA